MKRLFAIGLILQILAQLSFSIHSESVNLLEPIDFIHWTLLIGVVLVIPYTMQFSKDLYYNVGVVLSFIGIICHIGMCMIDFVLWAHRDNTNLRNELAWKLMDEPSIWPIFISFGPPLLIIGLTIQALGYFKENSTGTIISLVGSMLLGAGNFIVPEYRVVFITGYVIFTIGLLHITFKQNNDQLQRA